MGIRIDVLGRQAVAVGMFVAVGAAGATPLISPIGSLIDNGATTFDAATGRKWLDVSASSGVSYDQMKAWGCDPTCVTGPFKGWTFAQAGDVRDLVVDAGLPYGENLTSGSPLLPSLQHLIRVLGGTIDVYEPECVSGCGGIVALLNRVLTATDLIGSEFGDEYAGNVQTAEVVNIGCCGEYGAADSTSPSANLLMYNYASPVKHDVQYSSEGYFTRGAWLYSVPEPSPSSLLALALAVGAFASSRFGRRMPGA